MQVSSVSRYLSSSSNQPFFLFIGDDTYDVVKGKLSEFGLYTVKVSDFCRSEDKLPDVDGLLEKMKTFGENANGKKMAVIGLGEYLALMGQSEASHVLGRLEELNIGAAKAVLLLRGVTSQVAGLQTDLRFDERRFHIVSEAHCDLSITLAPPTTGLPVVSGIKDLLRRLENGAYGNIIVNTAITFDNALLPVRRLTDLYDVFCFTFPSFYLPRSCGNQSQWGQLLAELNQKNGSFEDVLAQHDVGNALETRTIDLLAGSGYRHWLHFIALKTKVPNMPNNYLRYVLENTSQFEDFKHNVLNAIMGLHHRDPRFKPFYLERKALVAKFPESDIAGFVVNNRKDTQESIFRLTDNTMTEREEIISWVAKNGIHPQLADVYPALAAYLQLYVFNCGELSSLLTDYFDSYKRQKVTNVLEDDFLAKVDELAHSRLYNRLPTRNEIIDRLDSEDAFLLWIDALGVEYLAFITELVRSRGLSVSIRIARAELPTITRINRNFFDDWKGDQKSKNDELDAVKHGNTASYHTDRNAFPVHLAKELDIIKKMVDKAATELTLRRYKRCFIVSDHGASRLAVLHMKEEKYDTETTGEHSGRCCKVFETYDLPFATEENGYVVLADYGRFKGSRASIVEVHGGASLEEVVVPLIELTLKDGSICVSLKDESVIVDHRAGTSVTLFSNTPLKNASLVMKGMRFPALKIDDNSYKVALPDIKRAGEFAADVYEGDDLVGKVLIRAVGKGAKNNVDFDRLL